MNLHSPVSSTKNAVFPIKESLTKKQPVVQIANISSVGKLLIQFLDQGIDRLIEQRFVLQNITHDKVFFDWFQ